MDAVIKGLAMTFLPLLRDLVKNEKRRLAMKQVLVDIRDILNVLYPPDAAL